MKALTIAIVLSIASKSLCWENVPKIPTNRRSQFYLRHDDGAYKYGYDSGNGIAANQVASGDNQVEGFYSFTDESGKLVKVKYTAGVQGFVPEVDGVSQPQIQSRTQSNSWSSQNQEKSHQFQVPSVVPLPPRAAARTFVKQQEDNSNSDASYQISFNTGEHAREEKSDSSGNVQGRYSYVDEAGEHDLSYVAGADSGFVVTGGSLATANGLNGKSFESRAQQKSWSQAPTQVNSGVTAAKSWQSSNVQTSQPSSDGSYSFSYNTGDHSRTESADANGNVQGKFAYTDEAGNHDLSYVAGAESGFVVTGGSLATANGLNGKSFESRAQQKSWSQAPTQVNSGVGAAKSWQSSNVQSSQPSSDGSYSFSYNTGDHSRTESADANGNVQGKFAYTDEAGNHDLSYVAGADSGFVVTGGSLATANGLNGKSFESRAQQKSWSQAPIQVSPSVSRQGSTRQSSSQDGSAYEFSYNTDSQSRQESSDGSGRVRGGYAVQTDGGHQQLKFDFGKSGSSSRDFSQSFNSNNQNSQQSSQGSIGTWTDFGGKTRAYNTDASVHPTFTVITPSSNQRSLDYGPKNAVILGYLPPRHAEKHGYIYDTPN